MSKPVANDIRFVVHSTTWKRFGPLMEKYRRRGGRLWRVMARICNPLFSEMSRRSRL